MEKNKTFRLKPKANSDLINIYDYSCQEFGVARAEQYIRDLSAAFVKLSADPGLGRDYSFISKDLIAYTAASHVVFYKTTPDGITIIRILHKSMDYERYL